MNIYIKKSLENNIGVVKQLKNLIQEYQTVYGNAEEQDSFSDYQESLKVDSVKKFLDYMLTPVFEDPKEIVKYLTALFYSVKGTRQVFNYLREFNIFSEFEAIITTKQLNIDIISPISPELDPILVCEYFRNFLSSLIYFETCNLTLTRAEIIVESPKLSVRLNMGDAYYNNFEVSQFTESEITELGFLVKVDDSSEEYESFIGSDGEVFITIE